MFSVISLRCCALWNTCCAWVLVCDQWTPTGTASPIEDSAAGRSSGVHALALGSTACGMAWKSKLCCSGEMGTPGQQLLLRFPSACREFGPSADKTGLWQESCCGVLVRVQPCSCALTGEDGCRQPWSTSSQPPLFFDSPTLQRLLEWRIHSPTAHSTVGLLWGNEGNKV